MRTFKRVLAISLALALLMSFSPAFDVTAASPSAYPQYDRMMGNYQLYESDDLSDPSVTLMTSNKTPDTIFLETDATGNTYYKFYKDAASSTYINFKYSDADANPFNKIVFEADVRWDNPGDKIQIYNLTTGGSTARKVLVTMENGKVTFAGGTKSTTIEAGKWHKITYVADVTTHTYDAFVDQEQIISGGAVPAAVVNITGIRFQSTTPTTGAEVSAEKDFYIDNIKFYQESEYKLHLKNYNVVATEDYSNAGAVTTTINDATGTVVVENGYLKFDESPSSSSSRPYITLAHGQGTLDKIVFEADIRWDNPGMCVRFAIRNKGTQLMEIMDGTLTFSYPNGSLTTSISKGQWHKLTYIMDLTTGKFEAFVDETFIGSKNLPSGVSDSTRASIRMTVMETSNADAAGRDFYVDNVKWYTYHHEYKVVDGAVVDENGQTLTEITETGILDLNGQDISIAVTGDTTKLYVADTGFMANGLDLTGATAAKLTVTEGADKVADWGQYGDFKYLKVQNNDGSFSFHPFNMAISQVGLNTVKGAICVEVTFIANDVVKAMLMAENGDYGFRSLNDDTANEHQRSAKANVRYQFTEKGNGVRAYFDLTGSLEAGNFDKTVEYKAFMKIGSVELDSKYTVVINPREIMNALNNSNITPTDAQLARIQTIMDNYPHVAEVLTRFQKEG